MKQTKFRGKDVETGEWRYGDLITNNGKPFIVNNVIEANSEYISLEDWSPVIPETVDQSISLQDKNGIDIYEGDIVKHKGFAIYSIEFECLKSWYYMRDKYDDEDSLYLDHKNIEIIGNIYDNPELLSK